MGRVRFVLFPPFPSSFPVFLSSGTLDALAPLPPRLYTQALTRFGLQLLHPLPG